MEEATAQVATRLERKNRVVKRLLKVDHQTNVSIEDRHPPLQCNGLYQAEETFVDRLVFPFQQTVQKRERHAVFEQSMEYIQLCERFDDASKRSVPLNERCFSEEAD